ncbi:MAG TPA: siderophore-interacting protein [Acidimicrobiales bacterium]|jgi:NADPH-dependent ferric siderophore reductase|nr:siderophore-interacting protein [Acidimicrobiales bacterium]
MADRPSLETSALLQRLDGVTLLDLEVVSSEAITPTMQRITCTAPELAEFTSLPGQDLMLAVPSPQGASFRRRYTIRSVDQANALIHIDIVRHGDGPGATWAATAQPGSHIEGIGPRGKITVDPAAAWHLFVGDDSAIPASLAMAESLGTADQSVLVLEVDGPADEQSAQAQDGQDLAVHWLHRAGADPASPANLVSAVQAVDLPAGPGHAYLAGELGVVAALRRALLERGLTAEQISSKPYWRAGVANAAHGEPERT